jgi:acetyltransferase-like isoleucine patch superfamily enzyme
MATVRKFRLLKRPFCWVSRIIGWLPSNRLRIQMYRLFYGYEISPHAKIGARTLLCVDEAVIGSAFIGESNSFAGLLTLKLGDNVFIGQSNVFSGPFSLEIAVGASIGDENRIECGRWVLEEKFKGAGYLRRCRIGANTVTTSGHYIDAVGGFELGNRSWIAGRDSQFWTHGVGVSDREIVIGQDNYIGSAVRFTPGSAIGNRTLVGVGSTVTKKFFGGCLVIAGVPAKIIKENYYYRDHDPNILHANNAGAISG